MGGGLGGSEASGLCVREAIPVTMGLYGMTALALVQKAVSAVEKGDLTHYAGVKKQGHAGAKRLINDLNDIRLMLEENSMTL